MRQILPPVGGLPPDMHHRPRSRNEIRLANVVPFFFLLDYVANKFRQLFIGGPPAHLAVQIVVPD